MNKIVFFIITLFILTNSSAQNHSKDNENENVAFLEVRRTGNNKNNGIFFYSADSLDGFKKLASLDPISVNRQDEDNMLEIKIVNEVTEQGWELIEVFLHRPFVVRYYFKK